MALFSYVLRYDSGSAPNPFSGVCTLAICKPAIRRKAQRGDWVVGTGSKNSPLNDISGKIVYAMRVSDKMTLAEYDEYTRTKLKAKIPIWHSSQLSRKVGDSIYDYSQGQPPILRKSVHSKLNRSRDLSGRFVLLANEFYYFGDDPQDLPTHLLPIVKRNQGHKRVESEDLINAFEEWISRYRMNLLRGQPQLWKKWKDWAFDTRCRTTCARNDFEDDRHINERVVC